MGNNHSSIKNVKEIKFGSINDPENSRPGYYTNGKILKYKSNEIELVPGENLDFFKKLKYGYALTNKRVFYKGYVIPNLKPDNCKIINRNESGNYSKLNSVLLFNGVNYYYKGNKLP